LKYFSTTPQKKKYQPVIFGDLSYLKNLSQKRKYTTYKSFFKFRNIEFVDLKNIRSRPVTFSESTSWGGKASGDFIESAVLQVEKGLIDGLVTLRKC
jgi:4-hydroxy-L-threonine phosphate dehydrogenase PdxA